MSKTRVDTMTAAEALKSIYHSITHYKEGMLLKEGMDRDIAFALKAYLNHKLDAIVDRAEEENDYYNDDGDPDNLDEFRSGYKDCIEFIKLQKDLEELSDFKSSEEKDYRYE